jgi:hypothetical protein
MDQVEKLRELDIDMDEWIKDENNICLCEGDNYGAFEYNRPGVYTGHYFFGSARGKAAIRISKDILDSIFGLYKAEVIQGLTPSHHKGALWLNRQLGFKHYGVTDTVAGEHQVFILTKADWRGNQ